MARYCAPWYFESSKKPKFSHFSALSPWARREICLLKIASAARFLAFAKVFKAHYLKISMCMIFPQGFGSYSCAIDSFIFTRTQMSSTDQVAWTVRVKQLLWLFAVLWNTRKNVDSFIFTWTPMSATDQVALSVRVKQLLSENLLKLLKVLKLLKCQKLRLLDKS